MTDRRADRVRVPDGRWVQFREHGPASAPTVLYCHGAPGSRHEIGWAAPVLDRSRVPVRLVAVNRPGYGGSTWTPLAGFAAWASDAAAVLDTIGVDECSVLGASGGAPFALAFAVAYPDRVIRLGVAAGVAPPTVKGMDRSAVWLREPRSRQWRTARYTALAVGYRLGLRAWLEERMLAPLPGPDRQALSQRPARAVLHQVVREAFAQRGHAAAHEAGLLLQSWDLDPVELDRPVRVWHGSHDTRVPLEVGHGLADLLPGASLTVWPQHGHFSWATSDAVTEIAAYLTGQLE